MTSQEIVDREITEAIKRESLAESAFKQGVLSAIRAGWLVNLILTVLVVFLFWQAKQTGKQMTNFKQTLETQNNGITQFINELASLQDQKVNDVLRKYVKTN